MTFRKKGIMVLLSAVMLAVFSLTTGINALADDYPAQSVTMYIPFAAGGSMDSSSRVLAAGAEKILGQPFVMINKTGGGGTVALGVLAGEKPDGYILSAGTSTGIFRIPVQRKVPYKLLADFTHIFAYAAVSSGDPAPAVEYFTLPGFFLAKSTNSCHVCQGASGLTTTPEETAA